MLVSTFMSCCKRKNRNQINVTTNPPSDNGTEDLVAGVPANNTTGGNGTTIPTITTAGTGDGSSIRPEATTKPNKSEIKETESKKEKTKPKSQIKTAKAMPKNVWELAYPTTTETVDEAANTKGHTATKE
uniref:Uncharacterized protein n=1 Tax=Panagrolaimus sp. ES5 TaxID=591445 RepID=A0AC34FFT2_9BILA